MFPQAKVAHFDSETKALPQDFNILMGTQAVLKAEGELSVDLAGILQFDAEMNRLDFRSGHRAFSLLFHLRRLAKEKLIVQTKMADSYPLKAAEKLDFETFYKNELKYRKELDLPPFRHLVAVNLRGAKEDIVSKQADGLYAHFLKNKKDKAMEIFEAEADISPKLRGKYRFVILIKGKSAEKISLFVAQALKTFRKKNDVIISVNIDP